MSMEKILKVIKEARRNKRYKGRAMCEKPNKDAVLKDVAFRLCVMLPISEDLAFELVRAIYIYLRDGRSPEALVENVKSLGHPFINGDEYDA